MLKTKPKADANGLVLHMPVSIALTPEQFYALAQHNRDLRLEQTAEGDILVMPPAGGETGSRNIKVSAQVSVWADRDGTGAAFDSSTGFRLPSGAIRSPDVAWALKSRLAKLTPQEKARFLPLCPDFVVELRSPSDALDALQAKLEEYIANGARLGWLLDPTDRSVYVYRPGQPVEHIEAATHVSGEPELAGFVLDLSPIWDVQF